MLKNQKAASDSVKVTWIIAGLIILLAAVALIVFLSLRPGTTVTTQGNSIVKASPDLVTVYFNVETNDTNASAAKDKNSEIVDNVITELLKLGIERKDIVTENYNIYPDSVWENGMSKIIGYRATHSIKVQLSSSKIEKAGQVIDAGVDAGALISYINFELSTAKQNELKAQALKEATQDARVKAESMASGLGKTVGSVVSVVDSSFNYGPWPIYRNDMMVASGSEAKSAVTSIQPGQQEVSAQVSVTYKLI